MIAHSIFENLAFAALVVLGHSEVRRYLGNDGWRSKWASSLIFAAVVAVSMSSPSTLLPGIQIDARHVLIGLASFLVGPIGAAVTVVTGCALRYSAGGAGALAGVIGIGLTASAALLVRGAMGKRRPGEIRFSDIVLIGVAINASLLSVFVLPFDVALRVLETGGIVVAVSNFIGSLAVGSMLLREHHRIESEQLDKNRARTDSLTGIANRRIFMDQVEQCILYFNKMKKGFSVLIIDVDDFKMINDEHGHGKGDQVLVSVGRTLLDSIRDGDLVARIGGDEFGVVLPSTSGQDATAVAQRILDRVRSGDGTMGGVSCRVSIGIAAAGEGATTRAEILELADASLYRAKSGGKDGYAVAASDRALHVSPT